MTAPAFLAQIDNARPPKVATEIPETIINAATPGTTLAASSVIDVSQAREVVLLVDFDAAAADDVIWFFPRFSCEAVAPLITDDVWWGPTTDDGSVTPTIPSAFTQLASVDFTLAEEFGVRTVRDLAIKLENTTAGTDDYKKAIPLRCTYARWLCVLYGNSRAAAGALTVKVVRST